ncbi:MAG: hypothetical protein SFW36_10060 [Leptolyngbyaceae cyanobacterium bins.59]|nr:hypothetical protein [Leptolyngbyaceae cyanobacterium bins.59]
MSRYQAMWQQIRNRLMNFKTEADLGPDLRARRNVNRSLLQPRPALSRQELYTAHWQHRGVPQEIVDFIHTRLQSYSGLQFDRVQPTDRLEEDLKLTLVSWYDWHLAFCEELYQEYGIDMSDFLDLQTLRTLEDLVLFVNTQLLAVSP